MLKQIFILFFFSKKNKIDEGSHGKMHNAQALSPADIEELGAVFTLINRHPG